MTTALPGNVGYGLVTGRFLMAVGDGSDPDRSPDGIPPKNMTVTFIAEPAYLLDTDATPPTTIVPFPIVCTVDETTGVLLDPQGHEGVYLVATNDNDLNPVDWSYRVTLKGEGIPPRMFNIEVPEDENTDLTRVSPVDGTKGDILVRGPRGYAATLQITVATGAPGSDATLVNNGDQYDADYELTVPRGDMSLIWRDDVNDGVWDAGTEYHEYDAVSQGGSSYRALTTTTGDSPATSPTKWRLLAQAGAGNVLSVNGKTGVVVVGVGDLDDVDDTGLTDGQVMIWNATSGKWEPDTPAFGGTGGYSTVFLMMGA